MELPGRRVFFAVSGFVLGNKSVRAGAAAQTFRGGVYPGGACVMLAAWQIAAMWGSPRSAWGFARSASMRGRWNPAVGLCFCFASCRAATRDLLNIRACLFFPAPVTRRSWNPVPHRFMVR